MLFVCESEISLAHSVLGRAYCFVIFVFVHGGLGILFVIAVARVLCVGHSSVFTRSRRSCTDVDVRSTLWRSRRRVSGTEGCPSHVSSGSLTCFCSSAFYERGYLTNGITLI